MVWTCIGAFCTCCAQPMTTQSNKLLTFICAGKITMGWVNNNYKMSTRMTSLNTRNSHVTIPLWVQLGRDMQRNPLCPSGLHLWIMKTGAIIYDSSFIYLFVKLIQWIALPQKGCNLLHIVYGCIPELTVWWQYHLPKMWVSLRTCV